MASVTEGGAERRSTEQLLESLIETFRAGCVVLENQSENCEDVLTHTINMAVAQMKQLADQTRTMDADGLRSPTLCFLSLCARVQMSVNVCVFQ